jgi:hypothetical protein
MQLECNYQLYQLEKKPMNIYTPNAFIVSIKQKRKPIDFGHKCDKVRHNICHQSNNKHNYGINILKTYSNPL